jgi:hypothetical protein
MGLLDDLKKQADAAKNNPTGMLSKQASIRLVNENLEKIARYFHDLAEQLTVLQPPCSYVFPVPGVGDMLYLKSGNFYTDYRRKVEVGDLHDMIDHVKLSLIYSSEQKFVIERSEMALIQRSREYLERHNFRFDTEERRETSGRLSKVIFTIPWEVRALVLITADYKNQQIIIATKNIERLGEQEFILEAHRVDEKLLDELAKFVISDDNCFRKLTHLNAM